MDTVLVRGEAAMNLYLVWFMWNNRGAAFNTHIVGVDVPDGWTVSDVLAGFWIDDRAHGVGVKIVTDDSGTMFVPPGRITGIVRRTK